MTLSDLAKSHVRTVVPFLVGLAISLGLRAGVDLHGYTAELTVGAGWLWYGAARLLEHYVSPKFGWLLGVATAPAYATNPPAAAPVVAKKRTARRKL